MMSRMTIRNLDGSVSRQPMVSEGMAFFRLAAYEDAMPLERVRELAQAEEDGRLVVLPCKKSTVYTIEEDYFNCAKCRHLVRRMPTIAPTPNDPLTLEELQEMDGEPVWAELLACTVGQKAGWALVYYSSHIGAACQRWTNWVLWYDEYGKTWTAYRRKPEEDK